MKIIIDVDVDTLNNCRIAIKNGLPTNEQMLIANGKAYYNCDRRNKHKRYKTVNSPK